MRLLNGRTLIYCFNGTFLFVIEKSWQVNEYTESQSGLHKEYHYHEKFQIVFDNVD